jgi:hypothetical protein
VGFLRGEETTGGIGEVMCIVMMIGIYGEKRIKLLI